MADDVWTLGRLLTWTTEYLARHGGDSPRLDAEVLLAFARNCSRIQLYTEFSAVASDELRDSFRQLVKQRSQGTPVAYLVGHREFYSLDFHVTPDVLIPRPETEFLVITLLDLVQKQELQDQPLRLADVGTGSGIVAVCAAKHLPHAQVWAIDTSSAALAIARQNVERHGVASRVELITGDLLSPLPAEPPLDFVLSNPPYVSELEWSLLTPDVRDHEPREALVGGPRGDELIQALIEQASSRLRPGGYLVFEISPMLASRLDDWFAPTTAFEAPQVIRDLAQNPRIISVRKSTE